LEKKRMNPFRIEGAQVSPGPCDPYEGCPPPTEIVCIEVPKVYDFCFQSERKENVCFDIPCECMPPIPADVSIECSITSANCFEVAREATGVDGFFNITLRVNVEGTITIRNADGSVRCTFPICFGFLKTVVLCAPVGTEVVCDVVSSRCGPCFIVNNQVCCEIDLCIIIQIIAIVKLLVPAYGFCVPAECETLPKPPLVCPPEFLFPPQCEVPNCTEP